MRVAAFALVLLGVVPLYGGAPKPAAATVQVYKSPTCGCCGKWVEHLRAHGFVVTATDVEDVGPYRERYKVPAAAASCHTAVVDGYVVEGHVPATDIQRLLRERPAVVGIAVPGMPIGSPGMEGANPQAYDVLSFDASGKTTVFASHRP